MTENRQPNRVKALTHKQFALVVERAKANRELVARQTSWPAVADCLSGLVSHEFRVGPHAARDVCSFADIEPAARRGGIDTARLDDLQAMVESIARAVRALYEEQEMTIPPGLARVLQIADKED